MTIKTIMDVVLTDPQDLIKTSDDHYDNNWYSLDWDRTKTWNGLENGSKNGSR